MGAFVTEIDMRVVNFEKPRPSCRSRHSPSPPSPADLTTDSCPDERVIAANADVRR